MLSFVTILETMIIVKTLLSFIIMIVIGASLTMFAFTAILFMAEYFLPGLTLAYTDWSVLRTALTIAGWGYVASYATIQTVSGILKKDPEEPPKFTTIEERDGWVAAQKVKQRGAVYKMIFISTIVFIVVFSLLIWSIWHFRADNWSNAVFADIQTIIILSVFFAIGRLAGSAETLVTTISSSMLD